MVTASVSLLIDFDQSAGVLSTYCILIFLCRHSLALILFKSCAGLVPRHGAYDGVGQRSV